MDPTLSPAYPSYEAYISALCQRWPEYQWLRDFFTNKPVTSEGTVLVMDAAANGISTKTFSPRNLTIPRNLDALFVFAETVLTKIIVVSYKKTEDIDRRFLEILGYNFDVDPLFYWHHFDKRRSEDYAKYRGTSYAPKIPTLLSHQRSLELGFLDFLHASILFIPHDSGPSRRWTGTYHLL